MPGDFFYFLFSICMDKTKKSNQRKKATRKKRKKITTFNFSDNLEDLYITSCLNCKYPNKIYINKPNR